MRQLGQRANTVVIPGFKKAFLLALIFIMPALISHTPLSDTGEEWSLHVAPNGVEVKTAIMLKEGLNTVPLPAKPIPETIELLLNGTLIPAIYDNETNTIYAASPTPGNATLTYLAQVVERQGALYFNVTPNNATVRLVIDPGVILLDVPPAQDVTLEGNLLIITLAPTNNTLTIPYVITQAIKITPTTTQTQPPATPVQTQTSPIQQTTTQAPITSPETSPEQTTLTSPTNTAPQTTPQQPTSTQSTPQPTLTNTVTQTPTTPSKPTTTSTITTPQGGTQLGPAIAIAVIGLIGIAGAFYLTRKTRTEEKPREKEPLIEPEERPPEELDETDWLVLDTLRKAGGVMMQSRLMRLTGLPKTSLWRRVKRLEQWGYLRVEREGKSNKIILLRMPEERTDENNNIGEGEA